MLLASTTPQLIFLLLSSIVTLGQANRFIQRCVGFSFGTCTDSGSSFVLDTVVGSDDRINDSFYNRVTVNGRCRIGSYSADGKITGAGRCSDLGLTAGAVNGGGGSMCNRCSARRRRLEQSADQIIMELSSTDLVATETSLYEDCQDVAYTGYLHVDDHFTILAHPTNLNTDTYQCPMVAAHVVHYHEEDGSRVSSSKEGMLWHDTHKGLAAFGSDLLKTGGSFTLSQLVQAVVQADHTNHDSQEYNILSNNCAIFVLNVARQLNVDVTPDMVSYVTRRLVAQTFVVTSIRDAYRAFWKDRHLRSGNDMTDKELVELVVEKSVNGVFV